MINKSRSTSQLLSKMNPLFFCAVGNSTEIMAPLLELLWKQKIDVFLGKYAPIDTTLDVSKFSVVCASGLSKWQMASKFLQYPQLADIYSHVFIWDDDLAISSFDPLKFCHIMEYNHLDVAQPAISSRFRLSHRITRAHAFGERTSSGLEVVGRFTNFVEIMAPVFTTSFWLEMSKYVNDQNPEGLGYDYIPIGTKGIIDSMTVEHTRPVRRKSSEQYRNRNSFLERNGFYMYPHANLGKLTYG